jgi:hypothetical protein
MYGLSPKRSRTFSNVQNTLNNSNNEENNINATKTKLLCRIHILSLKFITRNDIHSDNVLLQPEVDCNYNRLFC